MAAVGIAGLLAKSKHSNYDETEEEEEPMSKQLEILMERRRQEEVRKARFNWALLRNSIRDTVQAVQDADIKTVLISHGLHHQRKINHEKELKQVIFIKELDEYLTTDGQCIRTFMADGRKKKTYATEEPMDNIAYCAYYKQYVGWFSDGDELFLMTNQFEIISQSRAPSRIGLAGYNKHTHEFITVGPGFFVTWAFRYGARHLIPRKMNRTEFKENNMLTHMVLEGTASRTQKIFMSVHNSAVMYNVFEGTQLAYRKNLHERDITAMTYFNPLKYLVTGAIDGTIKVWDQKWHIQMVFVGHTGMVNALDIYPHGSAIISSSLDNTIRVWNLDTCDEVDRAILSKPIKSLQTTLDCDIFFTYVGNSVDLWKIQHLFQIHTSVGQRPVKIQHTSHPNFSVRSVVMSRDSSVRIISPTSGDVITTLLLNPHSNLVDVAYAIEEEKMFCVLGNGDILKVQTNTNPCRIVDEWKCADPDKEACNYLFVYEYVVDIQLTTDTWAAIKRGVTTKALNVGGNESDDDDGASSKKKKKNVNRTLLLGGRKDGYICVFNWETGDVEFKIDAHGSKGVMSMIANAKVDQLISAGRDNVIKVWRVYPFVQESLAPLMSFFCAHLPLHMTMIKTNLCVAFQDHATATYSVVMYNLRDRNRYDHEPGDDHSETITGLSACSRLKLYASCSLDGTIRVWNETNTLVRMLKLKAVPYSVGFSSARGDLLVGIGDHLYKIPHYTYLPKAYMFKMVSMKFTEQPSEGPIPENSLVTKKMSKNDLSRMKNSHSSFKFKTFTDILTPEEEEEINRERLIKEKAFNILQKREDELNMIKEGELISSNKPKSTVRTKKVAFNQYMKMFYDKPKPTIPKDDPYPEDRVKDAVKTPEPKVEAEWIPEKEPTGFFPPASEAIKTKPPLDSPLTGILPLTPSGYIPNSILVKLLWPQEAKDKYAQKRKQEEWKLPSFSAQQLKAIAKAKQLAGLSESITAEQSDLIKEREQLEERKMRAELQKWPSVDSWRVKSSATTIVQSEQSKPLELANELRNASGRSQKSVSFEKIEKEEREIRYERKQQLALLELTQRKGEVDGDEDDGFDDRVMQMDWGEDEEVERASPNIFESDINVRREKSDKDEKPSIPNKFADIMARAPTPKVDEEELDKEGTQLTIGSQKTLGSKQTTDVKQVSDVSSKASSVKEVKPLNPIKKLVSRPPPPLKVKTPEPVKPAPTQSEKSRPASRTKTRTETPPPPRTATPLPGFITQFKGVAWFEKFYPGCNEKSIPKPWSLENFVTGLIKLLRSADFTYKTAILEAIMMLHAQDDLADNLCHSVTKALISILNHPKDYPTCVKEDEKNFIMTSLKAIQRLATNDKEFITEAIVQFLDGDKEIRFVVISMLTNAGLQDPHKHIPKEFDSWDIWNVDEDDRKTDLRKLVQQWMDRWMTSYKLHLEDAIDRMKKGQNIHGRMTKDQMNKQGSMSGNKSILRRSVGVGTDQAINEDQETVTTLDDTKNRGVTVTFDRPPDPSLIDNATFIDAMNFFCDMMLEKELEAMKGSGKKMPGSKENVVQAKNTVLVLPKIPHKPSLVRLGETHTSHCRPHRETNLQVDYRLPLMTNRGYHPLPGQISGFVNSINLPLKTLNLNPFRNILDEFDARFQEPILITLKSSQKYFIPSQSIVSQEVAAAL